jgi:hypothetical protein
MTWAQFWLQPTPLWMTFALAIIIFLVGAGVEANCKEWIKSIKEK